VTRALRYLGEPVSQDRLLWLSQLGSDIPQVISDILNDTEAEVINQLPLLGIVSNALAVTANVASVALPSDLMDIGLFRLSWIDTSTPSSIYDGKEIQLMRVQEADARWPGWIGTSTYNFSTPFPMTAVLDFTDNATGGKIVLIPTPSQAGSIKIQYRQNGTLYTPSNINDPASTVRVLVPTRMIKVLAYAMALEFAMIKFPDNAKAAWLESKYDQHLQLWQNQLGDGSLDFLRTESANDLGYASLPNNRRL
jgi:hypothetical protein